MIAFIICRDKFTNTMIHFFHDRFPNDEFAFFVRYGNWEISAQESLSIYEVEDYADIVNNTKNFVILQAADRIVISGVFFSRRESLDLIYNGLVRRGLLGKTYFHFWGGDFYCYRDKICITHPKEIVKRYIMFYAFRKARGLVFLIDGEYEKFQEITHISNRHFVAGVTPPDPVKLLPYRIAGEYKKAAIQILVGNSATKENCHLDAFQLLLPYKQYPMKVICPLSYGDADYRETVISAGRKMFGDNFSAITDYMEFPDYLRFLSTIDIGVFDNNRQQAMGNIYYLLGLGKKVYLRNGTSMQTYFNRLGFTFFLTDEIGKTEFEQFSFFSQKDKDDNVTNFDIVDLSEVARNAWEAIFREN